MRQYITNKVNPLPRGGWPQPGGPRKTRSAATTYDNNNDNNNDNNDSMYYYCYYCSSILIICILFTSQVAPGRQDQASYLVPTEPLLRKEKHHVPKV